MKTISKRRSCGFYGALFAAIFVVFFLAGMALNLFFQSSFWKKPWDDLVFDPLYAPYYAQLSQEEQQLYRQLYYMASETLGEQPLDGVTTEAGLDRITLALYQDQPQFFWWDGEYSFTYYEGREDRPLEVELCYNDLAEDLEPHQEAFEKAAASLLDQAKAFDAPVEQELSLHDALIDRVVYEDDAPYNQSAYSALVLEESVCAGYTRAFQYLLLELGIPCYFCPGTASEEGADTELHSWNIVWLEDAYYNVDVTWDDSEDPACPLYLYFNRTDEVFRAEEHFRDSERGATDLVLPACTGETLSFEEAFGTDELLESLETHGLAADGVIASLKDYYRCTQTLLAQNPREETTLCLLVEGEAFMDQLCTLMDGDALYDGYLNDLFAGEYGSYRFYDTTFSWFAVSEGVYWVEQEHRFR